MTADPPETNLPPTGASGADVPPADVPAPDGPAADPPEADGPATDVPATDVPATDVPEADPLGADPLPEERPLQLRVVTHSEIGLVRKNNQDSGFASPRLLVVADGMGGAAAGDLASAVAIDTIRRIDTPATGEEMLELLAGAIHRANDRIADLVEEDYSLEGMGTTVTGALFDGAELGLAHIGDSRAYLLRGGELQRLTHDHSWVQSLVDDGKISEAEAAVHPHRSLLLRVLNGQASSEPDMSLVRVQAGDRLLFCSDGLCGLVDDEDIAATLAEPDLTIVLGRLVELAHVAGGIDNITIILADLVTEGGTPDSAVLGAAAERELPPLGVKAADEDTIVTGRLGDAAAVAAGGGPGSGAGAPAVEDEARYNPRAPHRRRALRPILLIAAVVLVLAAGLGAAYSWTRSQYYVGRLRRAGRDLPGDLGVGARHPAVQRVRGPADRGERPAAVLPGAGPRHHRRRQPGRSARDGPGTRRRRQALRRTDDQDARRVGQPQAVRLHQPEPDPQEPDPEARAAARPPDPAAAHAGHVSASPTGCRPDSGADVLSSATRPASAEPVEARRPPRRSGHECRRRHRRPAQTARGRAGTDHLRAGADSVGVRHRRPQRRRHDLAEPAVPRRRLHADGLGAHLAVRFRLPYADPVILPCVVLLNGLGLAMIHRIDLISDPPAHGARQQLIWTALGVILFILVVAVLRDHRPLQRFTYTLGLAGIALMLLPMLPVIGEEKFGARIWIQIGPYSFQPAEAAKILLAIAFASYLVEKRDVLALAGYRILGIDLPRARDLGPILVMWLISLAILVVQRDLGTSLLFFGLFVMMLYVATERAGWVVLGTAAVRARGVVRLPQLRPRPGPGRRLAGSVLRLRHLLPGDPGPVRDGLGRAARHRPRARSAGSDPAGPQRLHRRRDRRGARRRPG